MKKFSDIISEKRTIDVQTRSQHPAPSLVLFGDILDAEKVIRSAEIEKLAGYFFGSSTLTVVQVANPEKLHDWFREEQYKADVQGLSMIYPVKARFEEWATDAPNEEYSGPLSIQLLCTDEVTLNILTIACQWYDGLFRNDYFVAGAIVDSDDLEKIIEMCQQ